MRGQSKSIIVIIVMTMILLLGAAEPVFAYVGPGAGLEYAGYFMALATTVGVAFLSMLMYPIYSVIRFFRGTKAADQANLASPSADR